MNNQDLNSKIILRPRDHDADYYILTDDVLSEYACEEHLEGTIERAQA